MPISATGKARRWPRQAGASLVDVLVALAVLGIGLAALLHMLGNAAGLGFRADQLARALELAETQLAEALTQPITARRQSGEGWPGHSDDMVWALTITPEALGGTAEVVPWQVQMTVRKGQQVLAELTTVRLAPP